MKKKGTIYEAQSRKINSRILNEIKNLKEKPSPLFHAAPLENDLHTWHFTLRGYPDSIYDGGLYHGVIKLSSNYPLTPPDIQFFTPNGRFHCNRNICLSASGFHPESWTPLWKVRNLVEAIGAFMLSEGNGIGKISATEKQRKKLAQESRNWTCKKCKHLKKQKNDEDFIVMTEIEKEYMINEDHWKVATAPSGAKLFSQDSTPKKQSDNKQSQSKPVVIAEAQQGVQKKNEPHVVKKKGKNCNLM